MKLIRPEEKYYESYKEAAAGFQARGISAFMFLPDQISFAEVMKHLENYERGIGLPKGWVPETRLWMVDEDAAAFLGEVSIRHALTDALLKFGGNIGYGVRCDRWGQGIGTKMLAGALEYSRDQLHLEKVLITCSDVNYGSARVIEKNGGILQDKIENIVNGEKRLTRRYWICL